MITRNMTQEQIRLNGLEALAHALGTVGMVRFLQQFETGQGDYSSERHTWLKDLNVKTLAEEARQQRLQSDPGSIEK